MTINFHSSVSRTSAARPDPQASTMRAHVLFLPVAALSIVMLARASMAADHQAVQPSQLFSNPILQIHAPPSEGWFGAAQTATQIAFGKSGASSDESYIAAVILFRLPDSSNSDALTDVVKKGIERDTPADRFDILESTVNPSADRGYPCVKYHAVASDKKAATSSLFRKTLRLEITSLYCRHPRQPNMGFMASFSQRGGKAEEHFVENADKFINGIQVTPQPSAPAATPTP